jgi:hypothetical protein
MKAATYHVGRLHIVIPLQIYIEIWFSPPTWVPGHLKVAETQRASVARATS